MKLDIVYVLRNVEMVYFYLSKSRKLRHIRR